MEVSPIQSLIDQGKFKEVIATVSEQEKPTLELTLYKSIALAMSGDFKTAEEHASECISEAKVINDQKAEQASRTVILLTKGLRGDQDTHDQLELCKNLVANVEELDIDYWIGFQYLVEGMLLFASIDLEVLNDYYQRLQVVSEALNWEFLTIYSEYTKYHINYASPTHEETIKNLHSVQKKANEKNYRLMEWYICGMISAFYLAKGEFGKFREYAIKANRVWAGNKLCIADIYYYGSLGLYHFNIADLDNAMMYYQKALNYSKSIGCKVSRGFQYRYLGEILYRKGELKEALDFSQKGLQQQMEEKSVHGTGESHIYLGKIYQDFGDLEFALEHYLQGLDILQGIEYNPSIAESYDLIGNLYLDMNQLDKAKDYFEKSLEIKRQLENPLSLVTSLFNLVRVNLQLDNARVDSIFEEMKTISSGVDNAQVTLYNKLARALILKNSKRALNQSQSQLILIDISEMPVIDHNLSVLALHHLTELLLQELKISGNKDILSEIEMTIEKLVEIADSQNMPALLIRAYLFRARLSMLNLQLEEAKKIQVKAHDLAEEKGLRHLSFLVSNEMDEFARQVNRWGELASSSFDVEQVIELSQLEMILNRTDLTEQEVNMGMPILLLILSKDGGVRFSNKFSELDVNEDMVGSFLNAIKRLGEDAFYKKGSIDRIVHQNYTILIKLVGSFSFCFVLEGSSYGTIEKFDVFIDTVQSTTAWQNFHTHPVQMDNDLFTILKRICDDLFDPEILTAEVNTGSQKDEIYEEEP
ncbi:MAG: tetratricopeptide repeat protein, partial [Candidatus Kariarchaeaceae archaeon]